MPRIKKAPFLPGLDGMVGHPHPVSGVHFGTAQHVVPKPQQPQPPRCPMRRLDGVLEQGLQNQHDARNGLKGHVAHQHQLKRQGHLSHRVLMTVDSFREMVWVDYSQTVGRALREFRARSGADRRFRPRGRADRELCTRGGANRELCTRGGANRELCARGGADR